VWAECGRNVFLPRRCFLSKEPEWISGTRSGLWTGGEVMSARVDLYPFEINCACSVVVRAEPPCVTTL
jgi:hypothetical protein